MFLERLLQINLATLAALGALLLGMGQRDAGLPLLVLVAAPASIWLTDVTGWIRLSRRFVGLISAAIIVFSLAELWRSVGDARILGIANLVVYLQVVLFFQQKDQRVYQQLATLSLLQVVVATIFSQGAGFGGVLVVYMLAGFSAMSLLLMHQQFSRHHPTAVSRDITETVPHFTSTPAGRAHAGIGLQLFGRLGRMGLGTGLITLLLFFTVPRLGGSAWRGALSSPRHVVGFSDTVQIGALGEIIESRQEVMRVRFFDHATGKPYPVHGEIYLYGTTLSTYSQGRWAANIPIAAPMPLRQTTPLPTEGLVLQQCDIEPMDRSELFCVMPWVAVESNPNVLIDQRRQWLFRDNSLSETRFSYTLGTTAMARETQQPMVPLDGNPPGSEALQLPTADDDGGLPHLTALAEQWITSSTLPAEDRLGRARLLEAKLASSGQFQYSLKGQSRDPSIDPIEDFIVNNPRGHCEYFATALTMMLRSQGIPARMVVGYKCHERNELGGYYQVRQRHAHAWVEAYLRPEDLAGLPSDTLHAADYWDWSSRGGWLRLDPTPVAAETEPTAFESLLDRFAAITDWFQSIWENYVMGMDRSRQIEAIYQPLVRAVRSAIQKLRDPQWWRGLWEDAIAALGIGHHERTLGAWLRLGLTLVVASALLAWGLWRLGRLARWLRARLRDRRLTPAPNRTEVEFYRRLESLLAQHGQVRPVGQTPREFAAEAGPRIAAAVGRSELAPLPMRVVDAFYQVRFGRLPLDNAEAMAVEHALAELASANQQTGPPTN